MRTLFHTFDCLDFLFVYIFAYALLFFFSSAHTVYVLHSAFPATGLCACGCARLLVWSGRTAAPAEQLNVFMCCERLAVTLCAVACLNSPIVLKRNNLLEPTWAHHMFEHEPISTTILPMETVGKWEMLRNLAPIQMGALAVLGNTSRISIVIRHAFHSAILRTLISMNEFQFQWYQFVIRLHVTRLALSFHLFGLLVKRVKWISLRI